MRQRRAIPCEEVREPDDESDDERLAARTASLTEALATLPEEQREVLVLRHVVGLTPRRDRDAHGQTEPSIHGLHHRGRGALRAALASRDCAPDGVRRAA